MPTILLRFVTFVALACATGAGAQELEIVHINVGQGDATLILGPRPSTGDRVAVLFDAGNISNPDGGERVAAVLAQRNIRTIDYVIVSHYDTDHTGGIVAGGNHGRSFLLGPNNVPGAAGDDDGDGLANWLGDRPFFSPDPQELGRGDDVVVRRFVDRGDEAPPSPQSYQKYLGMARAASQRISLTDLASVNGFEIDLGGGARLVALAANGFVRDRPARVPDVGTENERSLSFLLTHGRFQYLISGDLIGRTAGQEDARVEAAVADYLRSNNISVDVLHANHHGADNASATEFLDVVRPEVVIISAGNGNSHGHPRAAALERIAAAGAVRIIQTEWGSTEGILTSAVRQRQAIYQGDITIRATPTSYVISASTTFPVDQP